MTQKMEAVANKILSIWVNTGSDMVYASKRGGRSLKGLCTQTKKLKTFKEQSVFTIILFLYYTKQELNAILQ